MTQRVLIWLLFEEQGAVLLARRKTDGRPFGGSWTLPGDEMELDESASETVRRFARDQLGILVRDEEFVDTFYLAEGATEYAVTVFRPSCEGELRYRESGPYSEVRWCAPDELPSPVPQALSELLAGRRHWVQQEAYS
jgi:ADP-ribose pyrophosphatase YjhB (NUDIX family)